MKPTAGIPCASEVATRRAESEMVIVPVKAIGCRPVFTLPLPAHVPFQAETSGPQAASNTTGKKRESLMRGARSTKPALW